jgi:hypothetical protein
MRSKRAMFSLTERTSAFPCVPLFTTTDDVATVLASIGINSTDQQDK